MREEAKPKAKDDNERKVFEAADGEANEEAERLERRPSDRRRRSVVLVSLPCARRSGPSARQRRRPSARQRRRPRKRPFGRA